MQGDFKDSLELMITRDLNEDLEKLEEVYGVWIEAFRKNARIYSTITVFFYQFKNNNEYLGEKIGIFLKNLDNLFDQEFALGEHDIHEWIQFLDKVRDHIKLTEYQLEMHNSNNEEYKRLLDLYKKALSDKAHEVQEGNKELTKEFQTENAKILRKFKLAERSLENVKKEFVAILGIFASILLAAFGGLSILENVMSNIEKTPTGKLMLFSSLTIAGVLLIVFTLLNGISKLTGLNLRSCGCDADGACNCSIPKKHPTVFIASVVLSLIALAGISEYVIEYDNLLQTSSNLAGFFIVFTLSIIFGAFTIYRISQKNESTKSPSEN